MKDPRQSGETLAELETKVGLNLLDTMIYHQETIERHLSGQSFPVGGDEVNKILKGGNYGWKISSYGEPYFKFISPLS